MIIPKVDIYLEDAVKRAEEDPTLVTLKNKNKLFLNSAFVMIHVTDPIVNEWHLNYYNPKTKKNLGVLVSNAHNIIQGFSEIIKKEDYKIKRLDIKSLKFNIKDIIKIAQQHKKTIFKEPAAKIMLNLYNNTSVKNEIWSVNFITNTLRTFHVTVDARSGKILSSRIQRLWS